MEWSGVGSEASGVMYIHGLLAVVDHVYAVK